MEGDLHVRRPLFPEDDVIYVRTVYPMDDEVRVRPVDDGVYPEDDEIVVHPYAGSVTSNRRMSTSLMRRRLFGDEDEDEDMTDIPPSPRVLPRRSARLAVLASLAQGQNI